MKGLLTAVILMMFACISCNSDKIPADIIQPDKMKKVIWDMVRAEQIVFNDTLFKTPSAKKNKTTELYQQVFSIYKIDRNSFYNSYKYYEEHPDLNRLLMDSVNQYSGRKRQELYNRAR